MATPRASDSRGYSAVATSIAFVALAGTFVSIRLIARIGFIRRCGADDFLIICALALSLGLTVCIALQQKHGLGRHFDTLSSSDLVAMMKPFYASIIIYNLGLTFTKCSILCQYLRFFGTSTSRRICWAILAVIIAYGFCSTFGSIFACTPIKLFWDTKIQGHCINLMAFWFSNASLNIVSDLAICILPIPVLKSLNLPKRQKIGLLIVFILGGFGCVTSILRLHSLYVISRSTDVTWDNVGAATWSSVELNTGIVCACLPTLKPVLSQLFPHLLHSRQHDTVEMRNRDLYIRHGVGHDGHIYTGGATGGKGSEIHHSQIQQTITWENDTTTTTTMLAPSPPPKEQKYSWSITGPEPEPRSPRSTPLHRYGVSV